MTTPLRARLATSRDPIEASGAQAVPAAASLDSLLCSRNAQTFYLLDGPAFARHAAPELCMDDSMPSNDARLLSTLERLLDLPAAELRSSLDQASLLVVEALGAEKVDVFLHEPEKDSLCARGTSDTPLGRRQASLGLDFQPIANGGSTVEVFVTGKPHITGRADQVPNELPGVIHELGIRSHIAVPLEVAGERRGVLCAQSQRPDFFTEEDLRFLGAVARWIGAVAHRAELVEQITQAAIEQGRHRAADELITVMAHDLRNYLTPLSYRLDLLKRRAAREDRQDSVRDAEGALQLVGRLTRIISDLLDVGRLEQGIFSLALAPVDLVKLAHDTAAALSTPDIPVHVNGPPELVATVDPDRIRQALENLISNAVKHSPKGKAVTVQLTSELRHAQRVAIVDVVDHGPGVPPEILPHIFGRFVTGKRSSGLGLGLYLASRIAESHGGTLSVNSPPGQGASFRLMLLVDGPPDHLING
jgi:signal transduction histidine kinase